MFSKTLCAATFMALVVATGARAQEYPTGPVTLVMPFSAGGPGDTLARIVGQGMTKIFKQQVIVENAAGAGGTIGTAKVAGAKPDGHTLLMIHVSHATNPALYQNLRYDAIKDFEPVGLVAELPMAFVAKKDFPPGNFKDLVAYVKANKDKVNYGHAGIGSASHLCGLLFFSAIETSVTNVPYKGAGPAMNDLMGGQFDFMCDQIVNVISPIKSGKIKAYAVTSKTKAAALPTLPPVSETLPGFEVNIWYALFAPKGTSKPVVDKLVAALQNVLADPAIKTRLADLGAEPVSSERVRPEALRTHLKGELDKWGVIIKKAGVYATD